MEYVSKINYLEVYNRWKLILRAWKVDDNSFCIEYYLTEERKCDLTRKEFIFYLKKLNIPEKYIDNSFGEVDFLFDKTETD
ncbi:MAG: hypothetical protein QW350_04810 [Candidatus Aenigmatarchaeota archaeon]